ncbi:AlpA family phage regulatory protein [Maritimibacter fusiformis]|uniref:AlpA family phage regulatory protein n=2 Tax=Maritimibacter fusiformis TaxID=2603819 RepID=A0A5D0RLZ0_9RHOB|nr:AlpA family phage regulatory protein [Maritimibacter fusiformis]
MTVMNHPPAINIPPARRFVTDVEIGEIFGCHRTWVWRMLKRSDFPRPLKLSPGVTRWRAEDIEAWIAEKEKETAK